jgi:formylglycine-generating enzyme required for sulfatase activity
MIMKKHHHIGFLILIILISFAAQSASAEQVLYTNNTQVNLRSSPTTKANNIITTIPNDTPVTVLQQQGAWYNVRLPDGREGWISRWVLTSREEIPDIQDSQEQGLVQIQSRDVSPPPDLTEKMVYISEGNAIIGSDENDVAQIARKWDISQDMLNDELPKEKITVRGFYIDQYEVTNAQYKMFVDATRYPPPLHWVDGMYPEGKGNHPVTFVSWDDAQAYAQWAGKRLPTAEEWEVAARGMNGQLFPWGDTYDDRQQVNINNPEGGVGPVGSYQTDVSAFDVYDMGGNIMEWTMTQYEGNKDFFILKGSSWATEPFEARGANQTPGYAEYQLAHVGFRCVKTGNR